LSSRVRRLSRRLAHSSGMAQTGVATDGTARAKT
jgi:hypothetical protein